MKLQLGSVSNCRFLHQTPAYLAYEPQKDMYIDLHKNMNARNIGIRLKKTGTVRVKN